MKALRIFYDSGGTIIGNIGLEGSGVFPYTKAKQLKDYPAGTKCLEIDEPAEINSFLHSEGNRITGGVLEIGTPIISPAPKPIRNLAAEIDELRAEIELLKKG